MSELKKLTYDELTKKWGKTNKVCGGSADDGSGADAAARESEDERCATQERAEDLAAWAGRANSGYVGDVVSRGLLLSCGE